MYRRADKGTFMGIVYRLMLLFAVSIYIVSVSGCGDISENEISGSVRYTKAVITVAVRLPADSSEQIGSIDLSLEFPRGVFLKDIPYGGVPTGMSEVIKLSGEGARFAALPNATAALLANYTPPTPAHNATVKINLITITNTGQGMNPGEFATITCDITPDMLVDVANLQPVTNILIGNATGTKLYDSLGGITGPANISYTVTLL